MSRKQFEPFVRWCNDDLTITERARGYLQGIPTIPVGPEITATPGATYTANEQQLIMDLKFLVNQLRSALADNGIIE